MILKDKENVDSEDPASKELGAPPLTLWLTDLLLPQGLEEEPD